MKLSKKFLISSIFMTIGALIFAQETQVQSSNNTQEEVSVESDYLNDMKAEVIAALVDSPDLESKMLALEYLQEAVDENNLSESVIRSLDDLAGEGITRETRERGRIKNNFPQIRRDACLILAQVPTEHSKNTLVRIAKEDMEPMVVAAAIKALGDISEDVDCVEEAVDAICFFNTHNSVMNPTSSLAWEVLIAFEKLADSVENKKAMTETIANIATNPNYNKTVNFKALSMLKELSGMSGKTKKSSSESSNDDEVVEVSEK